MWHFGVLVQGNVMKVCAWNLCSLSRANRIIFKQSPYTQFSELSKNLKYSRHQLERIFLTENYFAVKIKILIKEMKQNTLVSHYRGSLCRFIHVLLKQKVSVKILNFCLNKRGIILSLLLKVLIIHHSVWFQCRAA